MRILIIEDDKDLAHLTKLALEKENEVENKFFSDLTKALIECCKVEDREALLNSELDTMLREVEMNLQNKVYHLNYMNNSLVKTKMLSKLI